MIIFLRKRIIPNCEIKSHCTEEVYKQILETSKEIDSYIEDILETVYNDKTSVSSNL